MVKRTTHKKSTKSSKSPKTSKAPQQRSRLNLYSNLSYRRRMKADQKARRHAEDLATMPKNPFLRFFARLRPDRVFKFWFSKEGFFRLLKILAAIALIVIIAVGGLFLYFKKDLAQIDPEELANRVTNTVNTYYDRSGEILWEDKGSGDYRLVVESDDIATYMRQATVAIEDKNFYNHMGVDFMALIRAAWSTLSGGSVQGGSTLTQQLIKQVYFSDEAGDRTITGVPRKIKETILALEVEKMYDKEQIITMYLNESPYGGRRNGVESGAQTYFGKSAKDLTLAEAALLAAIPNNPAVFNPYNKDYAGPDGTLGTDLNYNGMNDTEELIGRQHYTLDSMVDMGYISAEEAKQAKQVDILDTIRPESDQYAGIKAPWFVLEVKLQLEAKYGVRTMRAGGFSIKTTLDYRAQKLAEKAVKDGAAIMRQANGADNIALTSVDVETAQVVSMVGSAGWTIPRYGQVNAATSLLEPASSIKPILDYTPLLMQREGQNWGPGSILRDENIDRIYCAGTTGPCKLRNFSGRFYGDITLRQALGSSLNIGAVKALYINGIENSLEVAHALGDLSYCTEGTQAGLSMAIGGGCTVRPVEHANAYASLARGGVYKPLIYWLEVRNSSDDVIDKWEDVEGTQVIDPQVAYMISDILSDVDARRIGFMNLSADPGLYNPDVWFAVKTGTTDDGNSRAKDSWHMSYSPVLATAIWTGKHDGSSLTADNHDVVFRVSRSYMEPVHRNVYGVDGKWRVGMEIARPAGLQTLTVNGRRDIWPSWYGEKTSGIDKQTMEFDRISKRLATSCTPDETRISVTISKVIDPMTQREIWYTNGYNKDANDNIHNCDDVRPTIGTPVITPSEDGTAWIITVPVTQGTHALSSYSMVIDGKTINGSISGPSITSTATADPTSIRVTVTDKAGYTATISN